MMDTITTCGGCLRAACGGCLRAADPSPCCSLPKETRIHRWETLVEGTVSGPSPSARTLCHGQHGHSTRKLIHSTAMHTLGRFPSAMLTVILKLSRHPNLLCLRWRHPNRTKEYNAATREEAIDNWVKWGQGMLPLPGCEVDELSKACIKEADRFKCVEHSQIS